MAAVHIYAADRSKLLSRHTMPVPRTENLTLIDHIQTTIVAPEQYLSCIFTACSLDHLNPSIESTFGNFPPVEQIEDRNILIRYRIYHLLSAEFTSRNPRKHIGFRLMR